MVDAADDNYTESCMVDAADGWRERNVWYSMLHRRIAAAYIS
ncbi:hypothetical protein [Clostridium transplantifaecale]|nr:hypothetical protein [Clostridium transplantifaecale]